MPIIHETSYNKYGCEYNRKLIDINLTFTFKIGIFNFTNHKETYTNHTNYQHKLRYRYATQYVGRC